MEDAKRRTIKKESRKRKYIQFEGIQPDEVFPEAFNESKHKRNHKGWEDAMEWILFYFDAEWNSDLEDWFGEYIGHTYSEDWYKNRIRSFVDDALLQWTPNRPAPIDIDQVTKFVAEKFQGIRVLGDLVSEYVVNHPIKPILFVVDLAFDSSIQDPSELESAETLCETAMTALRLELGRDPNRVCNRSDWDWAASYLFIDDVNEQIKLIERMFSLKVHELSAGEVETEPHPSPLFMEYRDIYCYVLRAGVVLR